MKKLAYSLLAVTLLASSCIDGIDNSDATSKNETVIPSNFTWKTTRDVKATVSAPTINEKRADYAIIRIYTSPLITAENQIAMGVTKAATPFQTTMTIPAGVENLYIETTLPDGTKSVAIAKAESEINLAGAAIETAATPRIKVKAATRIASSMPNYPTASAKTEADFAPEAVIRTTPTSQYDLGADYMKYTAGCTAAEAYYIPAGAVINGNIDLNGGRAPYQNPELYVAGTLKVKGDLAIGTAQLIVLPGGKVEIGGRLTASNNSVSYPVFYLFEGGNLTADAINYSGRILVNCGKIEIAEMLDLNNSATFYNTATAELTVDDMPLSNSVTLHNDGKITVDAIKMNSTAQLHNYENGVLNVTDEFELNNKSQLYQKGQMTAEYMESQSEVWIECYTKIEELVTKAQSIFHIASGAALETTTAEMNQSDFHLASGAYFITSEFNAENKGGKNNFTAEAGNTTRAVVAIKKLAGMKHNANFSGFMEVVYDISDKEKDFRIPANYLSQGAILNAQQITRIEPSVCNGGKAPVTPEPEPEPEEYITVKGGVYTYCFEDNWPFLGDYDVNDAVIVTSIDREQSKDGSKVRAMTINWKLKAAGTTYNLAFALQMDRVASSQIASITSSHTKFGKGIFASAGLESGNELAVIALFNDTKELLSSGNTRKHIAQIPAVTQTTKITFTSPIDASQVIESAMNFFIAARSRSREIHLPSYAPTAQATITNGDIIATDPFRAYAKSGSKQKDNYMMWALSIPGDFSYPSENNDIRETYTYFMPWATSGGSQHAEWYDEETNPDKIY